MPSLTVITPNLPDATYTLQDALIIGRHNSNQIQLQEERASRIHCRVRMERGAAIVEDLESANGVFVNGLKTKSQTLKHNDRIVIGATTLVYNEVSPEDKALAVRSGDTMVLDARAEIEKEIRAMGQRAASKAVEDAPAKVVEKSSPKPVRKRARARSQSSNSVAFLLIVLCLAGLGYAYHLSTKDRLNAKLEQVNKKAEPIAAKADVVTPEQNPQLPYTTEQALDQANQTALLDARMEERFQKALAQRDHALATGNVLGARSALQAFIKALPKKKELSLLAIKAKKEFDETSKVANATLQLTLDQALEAQEAQRFKVVFQRCTNLISIDPDGKFGKQAREMLEHIDERTQPIAVAATAKAQEAIKLGKLEQARAALEAAMGQLSGTHWAADVNALHMRIIITEGFLAELEAARAKKAAAKEKVPLVVAAKQINGNLLGLKGLSVQVATDEVSTMFPLRILNPDDFQKTLEVLGAAERHAELAALWALLERPEEAKRCLALAQQKPDGGQTAGGLMESQPETANMKRYDFSGWRQQTDWEALSGSWLTQEEKYVLETSDGGETQLKPEKIGGGMALARGRLSFDFEIRKPSNGWLFGCEFGAEKVAVVLLFTDGEVLLQDKSGNVKNAPVKWSGSSAHVELVVNADSVSLKIDGQASAKIEIAGLSKQSGTVSFQARQCACALDNIELSAR